MRLLVRGRAVGIAAVVGGLLVSAVAASAHPLPAPYPQSVKVSGAFYGGFPHSYEMCVAPCSFTATPPTHNNRNEPFTLGSASQWELHVFLTGSADPSPTVVPATSPSFSHVATEVGMYRISLTNPDDVYNQGTSLTFLVVSKADAPRPLKYLSSKTLKMGSVIRVKSPKAKVSASFLDGATKLRKVGCRPKVRNVHCLKLKPGPANVLVGTKLEILAWNKTLITDTFSVDGVADRKEVRVKLPK